MTSDKNSAQSTHHRSLKKSRPSSSVKQKKSTDGADDARRERLEQQRRRNIESAKRSRERLRNAEKWMEIQIAENEDRISRLENKMRTLSQELATPDGRKKKRSQGSASGPSDSSQRPSWFGQPF